MARLDDDLRAVYELHVADGLSYQEVSARLGIAVNKLILQDTATEYDAINRAWIIYDLTHSHFSF